MSYAIVPGAGCAGLTWRPIAAPLDAVILKVPDEREIPAMADGLVAAVEEMPAPRVLIGASFGAMIAVELARRTRVDALVLVAAGWGITVSDRVIERMERAAPDLWHKMARVCIGRRDDPALIEAIVADYVAGGLREHIRDSTALRDYTPRPLEDPPPTLVLWGVNDPAVPFEDHVELARRCGGALVPIEDAAHMPYLEQPELTLRWILRSGSRAPRRAGA